MNQTSYVKSRTRLAKQVEDCTIGQHDWCEDEDPITGRLYCKKCTAYFTGHIDEDYGKIVGYVGAMDRLGWYPPGHPLYHDGAYKTKEEE